MRIFFFSLIIASVLAALMLTAAMAEKAYSADRYDVIIAVQPDGSLIITENVEFRFEGGPFTYVNRQLEFNHLDEIDRLQAEMDGQELDQGTQPGQVEITVGRPLDVVWHFAPTSDAVHEFSLTYRVQGAISQGITTDSLVWRAIPEDHDYPISQSSIRIEYPPEISPSSTPTLIEVTAEFEAGDQSGVFTTSPIGEDTPVDVAIHFRKGSLVTEMPAWQAQSELKSQRAEETLPAGLGAAALAGIMGLFWLAWEGRRFRRDSITSEKPVGIFSSLPRSIAPALAARLTGSSTGYLGTFFYLAQQGMLSIEQGPKKWGSRTFDAIRVMGSAELKPHEQIFMDVFFGKSKSDRVGLSSVASLGSNSQFNSAVDSELTDFGWHDPDRSTQRGRFIKQAVLALCLGVALFIAGLLIFGVATSAGTSASSLGAILIGIDGVTSVVGLVGWFMAMSISTLSSEGERESSAWKGFADYLRRITRGREPAASPDVFERYLPYAAGFGLATEWANTFKEQADLPIPAWFHGLQAGLDDSSLIAVIAAITAADSSASAGGDGGGASGGGSSGAS